MKQLFVKLYILLFVGLFILFAGVDPFVRNLLKDEDGIVFRQASQGTIYLLRQEFEGLDENGMREKLASLQSVFGYPLDLYRIEDIKLDSQRQRDLFNGEIVLKKGEPGHYFRLGNSGFALATGPFGLTKLFIKGRLFFWGCIFVLLIVPTWIWAFVMQRNLEKIEKASQKFVAGDYSVRVSMPTILPIKQIASAFNYMAEGTQKLIISQKDLVNSVSHEIRTPLSRIKFSLEMLRGVNSETSGEKDYTREIYEDVEEINSLVDEMLTYARFERKREPLEVLLKAEMISWLEELVKGEQKNNLDKTICFKMQPQVKLFINQYEPSYLGRAVKNLIQNAMKYTNQRIDVIFESGKDSCCIHVDDDGPGIPVEVREKIFEPFSRLDQSRHRRSGGYGLGLAIAKRIVLWHKGEISVGTSPMRGARFTICLPVFS